MILTPGGGAGPGRAQRVHRRAWTGTSAWCIYDLKGEGMHNFRNLVLGELASIVFNRPARALLAHARLTCIATRSTVESFNFQSVQERRCESGFSRRRSGYFGDNVGNSS